MTAPPTSYFVDANLLVLLVVGNVDREFIPRHRRLNGYSARDYDRLLELIERVERVHVTPNTLTEASNLLSVRGRLDRNPFLMELRRLIERSREIVVGSDVASSSRAFVLFGLTDAALLEVATSETPILTTDGALCDIAQRRRPGSAINFTHQRRL